jgi:Fe-S oxidoreductase
MRLFNWFGRSSTLYFPGCTGYFKQMQGYNLYREIFSRLGIRFIDFEGLGIKSMCCGLEALEAGYDGESRKIIRGNFEIFKEQNIGSIITTSPECYKMFTQNYSEVIPDWNIEIKNIWKVILESLEKRHELIKNKAMEIVTFHDSCYLGRYCNIYTEPRKILELLGYEIKEMTNSHEDSFCCGSCGGLIFSNPDLANKIAKERILQAKRIGIKKIIVTGFENYNLLKKNIGDSGVRVFELSEVLANSFGIRGFEDDSEGIIGEENILEDNEKSGEEVLDETKANIKLEEEIKEEEFYDNGGDNFK